MKMFKKLRLLLLVLPAISFAQWTQVGNDIDGEAVNDLSGNQVSLSTDGSVVAIAAKQNAAGFGMYSNSGHVRVFENNSGTWTQVGADIDAPFASRSFGTSMDMSADGTIIAVGTFGFIQVFQNNGGTWTQVGADIIDNTPIALGYSIKLSADGSVLAVGAPEASANGSDSGAVRIYENISGTWTQIGADINGAAANDNSGRAISISADGSIVAIGAEYFNGSGSRTGHVRIFENISGTWTQIGNDIIGENALDYSGSAVDLSADGSIVAIGAYGNDGNGSNSGHVRVFEYTGSAWTQIGNDINGEAANDRTGQKDTVSLSDDGTVVAVSSYWNSGQAGHARVFKNINGTWTQVGSDIDGEAAPDQSGTSVAISGNGAVLAIGAPLNDGNGTNSGHVRVFTDATLGVNDVKIDAFKVFPNPTASVLNIESDTFIKQIRILDVLGKEILTTTSKTIDVSRLNQGMYLIEIEGDNHQTIIKRFIKQ